MTVLIHNIKAKSALEKALEPLVNLAVAGIKANEGARKDRGFVVPSAKDEVRPVVNSAGTAGKFAAPKGE